MDRRRFLESTTKYHIKSNQKKFQGWMAVGYHSQWMVNDRSSVHGWPPRGHGTSTAGRQGHGSPPLLNGRVIICHGPILVYLGLSSPFFVCDIFRHVSSKSDDGSILFLIHNIFMAFLYQDTLHLLQSCNLYHELLILKIYTLNFQICCNLHLIGKQD